MAWEWDMEHLDTDDPAKAFDAGRSLIWLKPTG
jgi:hypothetical protein